ncbi:MAG: SdiA-regulated domain-containing protein [Bacteroidales bacterium]|nr:SdiA-regulated domain-containing protein [Bacteroidales bacterium]
MNLKTLIPCIAMAAFAAAACNKDGEVHKNTDTSAVLQKDANGKYILKDWKSYEAIPEKEGLSSIALKADGTGFYGVYDKGLVYEIGLDGTDIKAVSSKTSHDWEGITVNPSDGSVYICDEAEWSFYKFDPAAVGSKDNPDGLALVGHVDIENTTSNRGFEGIACDGDNLYLANQANPRRIITWSLKEKKVLSQIDFDYPPFAFLSDIFFDSRDNTLRITDSKTSTLSNIKKDGTVISQYDISFVPTAEGFCIDTARGLFWFASDSTGKIYSASYK